MGDITQARLDALRVTYDALFSQVFKDTPTWYNQVSSLVSSAGKSNVYGWILNSFAMREWVGPRVIQNIVEHEYELSNKKWEITAVLPRTAFEDDDSTLNVFASFTMPNIAASTKKHPDILTASIIQSNGNAFDGVSFFNTSHANFNATGTGATTYSNDFSASDLTTDGVNTARSTMAAYIGENGYPLGVNPATIIVPPQLQLAANTVAKSNTYAIPGSGGGSLGPTTNSATVQNLLGAFDVIVVPELANQPTQWYLADLSKPIKPFLFQTRVAPELVARFNPQDPQVFDLDEFIWGARARYNAGYTLPYLCSRNTTG
jgi:phage major head subunit gpT-like protein